MQFTTLLLVLGVILAIAGGLIWLVMRKDAGKEPEKPKDQFTPVGSEKEKQKREIESNYNNF